MWKKSIAVIVLVISVISLCACGKTQTVKLEDLRCKVPSEWKELDTENGGERAYGGEEGYFTVSANTVEDDSEAQEAINAEYEGIYNMAEGTIVQEMVTINNEEETKYEYNYKTVEEKDRYVELVMFYHDKKIYYISYEYDGTEQKGTTFKEIVETIKLED